MSTDTTTQTMNDTATDDWAKALEEQAGASGGPHADGAPEFEADNVPINAAAAAGSPMQDIQMVLDIPVQLSVELGRTRVPIKYILQLAQGSIVELDALAGEPMDVLINGYLIAQGEVVVVNDKFGIRLTDIVTPSERMRRVSRT
ncbi:flagellar motor switch protein FliN [Hydrogenophaga sp.]|uniref:flagellar motor switch protein FliN n=1 Tax=Hydrogenophaga sp. TaxID=1904254 RepID=UPI00261DACDC|nr:flagellar motor switch protein FliN [Hydrogenophaga sp.]MCW5654300.1 flagellar motor switch protein FliN [Hydrogenophaga sp.]